MNSCLIGIALKALEILFNIDFTKSVQGCDIKIPHRLIKLGRIPCRHNDKAFRHTVHTEGFIL